MNTTKGLCECGCGQQALLSNWTDKRTGTVKGQPYRYINGHSPCRPLEERFWEKVNKNGTLPSEAAVREHPEIAGTRCWEWTAALTQGYGHIKYEGLEHGAHCAAWFLEIGRWPEPMGLHKCDNRKCVRFSHLFEGDRKANSDDMFAKGRENKVRGEQNGMSKLTSKQVVSIRSAVAKGMLHREAAKLHGVSRPTVTSIIENKTWKHVAT